MITSSYALSRKSHRVCVCVWGGGGGGGAYVGRANFRSNAPPAGKKYWSNTQPFCNKYHMFIPDLIWINFVFICTLHHGVNMNFANGKARFCKIQTRHKLKTLRTIMDDSSYRLNFDLGKKNEIHHYS